MRGDQRLEDAAEQHRGLDVRPDRGESQKERGVTEHSFQELECWSRVQLLPKAGTMHLDFGFVL